MAMGEGRPLIESDLGTPEELKPLVPSELPGKKVPAKKELAAGGGGGGQERDFKQDFKTWDVGRQREYLRERFNTIREAGIAYDTLRSGRNAEALEINAVLLVMKPEVRAEFMARKAIQEVGIAIKNPKLDIKDASKIVTDVDSFSLQTAFRLEVNGEKVVAKSFRAFHRFIDDYTGANNTEKDTLRRKIGHMMNGRSEAEADALAAEPGLPANYWTVLDGEDLFLLGNKAAQKGDETVKCAKKVLCYPETVVSKKIGAPFFRDLGKNDGPLPAGIQGGQRFVNLYIEDCWAWLAKNKTDWATENGLDPNDMANAPVENMDFVSELDAGILGEYWEKVEKADAARSFLPAFLNNPSVQLIEDAMDKNKLFDHLAGSAKDEAICNYLAAYFEYHIERGRGGPFLLEEQSIATMESDRRTDQPQTRQKTNKILEDFIAKGRIKRDSPATLALREKYGLPSGRLERATHPATISKATGDVAKTGASALLTAVGIFFDAVLGGKGGGKR